MRITTNTTSPKKRVSRTATEVSCLQVSHVHTFSATAAAFSTAHSSASQLAEERQVMVESVPFVAMVKVVLLLLLLLVLPVS